jgi:hypothetical protein
MKKYLLFLFCLYQIIYADQKNFTTSRTFFYYRPIYYNLAAEQSIWNSIVHDKQGPNQAAAQVMGMYQKSNRTKKLGAYFLLHCKDCVSIAGDATDLVNQRDIRAEWFNLPSNYVGTFSLNPHQQQAAGVIELNQNLSNYFESSICENRWLGIRLPIVWVKNRLNPAQTIQASTPIAGQQPDFITAINQPDITFSRFYSGSRHKLALSELCFMAGSTIYNQDDFHVSTYSQLIFPTAPHQKPEFLFDPYVGINGHIGIGAGMRIELPLHEIDSCYKAIAFVALEGIFFFQNRQCRTFDLKKPIDKGCFCPATPVACDPFYQATLPPQDILDIDMSCKDNQWSRFLLYRKPGEAQTVRGVTILTFPVKIYPYGQFDFSGGFRLNYGSIEAEISYNIWGRSAEQAIFEPNCCEAEALNFQNYGIAGALPGTSASQSTIAYLAPADANFVKIRQQDISFASGTYPGGMTHRFQASVGLNPEDSCIFAGIGGYYEIPFKRYANFIIQNWGIWGKVGLEF